MLCENAKIVKEYIECSFLSGKKCLKKSGELCPIRDTAEAQEAINDISNRNIKIKNLSWLFEADGSPKYCLIKELPYNYRRFVFHLLSRKHLKAEIQKYYQIAITKKFKSSEIQKTLAEFFCVSLSYIQNIIFKIKNTL